LHYQDRIDCLTIVRSKPKTGLTTEQQLNAYLASVKTGHKRSVRQLCRA
jgi:hypothetical protein